MKSVNIGVDPFRYLYEELRGRLVPKEEIEKNDLTEALWEFLKDKVNNDELINLTITGEVATGKSTVGIAIQDFVNNYIERVKKKKIGSRDELIFSDQTDFLRFVNSDTEHVCIEIDEYNRLAEGGINATTEQSLFAQISDTFAQRFVHRINCSPSEVMDKNSLVILEILGRDLKSKVTRCRLRYRVPTDMGFTTLGFVDIDVSRTLKTEHYRKYRTRKFQRMDLIRKHGVRDVRDPEFAGFVLKVYNHLKHNSTKATRQLIEASSQLQVRKVGRIYSIIAKMEITGRAQALLGLTWELRKLYGMIKSAKKRGDEPARRRLSRDYKKVYRLRKELENEEKALDKLYKEYLRIK